MTKSYLVRNLIDGHRRDGETRDTFLCVLTKPGALPRVCSAGRPGYRGALCLNHVWEGEDGMMLSPMSAASLSRDQYQELLDKGSVTWRDWEDRKVTVTMLTEVA